MPHPQLRKLELVLAKNGLRSTAARWETFLLLLNDEPQSMRDLLLRAGNRLDRVSIYRNIEVFEKLGIVHRIYTGWKYTLELSDDFIAHHHHMTCLSCGKVIDIADETHIDAFIHTVAEKSGFVPRRHQFEIDGYCQDCAATVTM